VQWLLTKLENQELNLDELYCEFKELINDHYELPERVSINITIVLLGLNIFRTLAGELGVNNSIPFDAVINSQVKQLVGEEARGSLGQLMRHTATMVASSESFRYGIDYKFDNQNGELILWSERWLAELWKFCRELCITEILSQIGK
jgi:hypothetical protein